jgi:hypothetical protein
MKGVAQQAENARTPQHVREEPVLDYYGSFPA